MYLQKRQMLQMLKFYFYSKTIFLYICVQTAEDIVERNVQFLRLFTENFESLNSHEYCYCGFFKQLFIYDKSLGFS